jgi:hypothetical protein
MNEHKEPFKCAAPGCQAAQWLDSNPTECSYHATIRHRLRKCVYDFAAAGVPHRTALAWVASIAEGALPKPEVPK